MRRDAFLALAAAILAAFAPRRGDAAPGLVRAPSFDESVAAIEALVARDTRDSLIAPTGLPRLYHHGHQTADAVLLFHGFTNCPQQFDELARRFHQRGANVYVPRIPLHGYRDRLTRVLRYLTDVRLQSATTEAYRLTRGLGARVNAVGLSLGGSMAMYLMQTQAIEHAVPVAPFLIPIGLPQPVGLAAMKTLDVLPDRYQWWDPRVKEKSLPDYAYPGFPTHGLAQTILFGNLVVQAAKAKTRPLGLRCTLVTNHWEAAVNNGVNESVLDAWKASGARVDERVLDNLGPPRVHDIIDPTTFPKALDLVYPVLESIVFGS